MQKRMYVIVRHDLKSTGYKAAQSGHALAQYLMDHKPHETGDWENDYLIFLETRSEFCLQKIVDKLERNGYPYSKFNEPDLGGQLTAIAALDVGHLLTKYDTL